MIGLTFCDLNNFRQSILKLKQHMVTLQQWNIYWILFGTIRFLWRNGLWVMNVDVSDGCE